MDMEHTSESQAFDEVLDRQIAEDSAAASDPAEASNLRGMRVDEYEANGLETSDPLEACLVAVNADLIRISFELAGSIKQTLATEPVTVERVRQTETALDYHLRVTRQIDRFAQLEMRVVDSQKELATSLARLHANTRQRWQEG